MPKPSYQEKLFSKFNAGIFVIVAGWLLFIILYQAIVGPWGNRPASNEFLSIFLLVLVAIGINFSSMSITLTSEGLNVGYGILKNAISWQEIIDVYLDDTSAIMYGGWGVRLGRVAGKWRLVYNVLGKPRVVVGRTKGWYREFVFSTQNPKEVIEIIEQIMQTR